MNETKTTADYMLDIATHYLMNCCEHCPFYDITETCDSKPINCTWMVLNAYFKKMQEEEEQEKQDEQSTEMEV